VHGSTLPSVSLLRTTVLVPFEARIFTSCSRRGFWICRNATSEVGFVSTKHVQLDPSSVRDLLEAIPKPARVCFTVWKSVEYGCVPVCRVVFVTCRMTFVVGSVVYVVLTIV
jgi:hypothetical protein